SVFISNSTACTNKSYIYDSKYNIGPKSLVPSSKCFQLNPNIWLPILPSSVVALFADSIVASILVKIFLYALF
nr:hypothetical protein [Vallitaleaceae bacterium]